ncbi:membrane fusion protein, cobalt-zinc-cadmium efflux system [Catalinimonas alkaloidigena]|uniref:Membrane fusion protein, cobalt-zinc-cadmium efflux system n=1 Tax=Catalinimonas alkaloidigena TaxID=1075417 RepID=A0A1G9HVJ1_9BACT|nr:efflux RND transporter periplasmic adaptor subunit [Catalinimonas alkaloidigena]SDL16990.1 membrane fusion protein, cobalt-zinc-cadmium efflux system [Catalinimonas alkaloidigena]
MKRLSNGLFADLMRQVATERLFAEEPLVYPHSAPRTPAYPRRTRRALRFTYGVLGALTLAVALTSCHKEITADGRRDDQFCLTDTLMKHLEVSPVQLTALPGELRLTARIEPDESRVIDVFPLVGGYVQEVNVQLGDYVEKGQTLAVIKSGEIAEYEQQLIAAQSNLLIAQKNLDVAEDLYQGQLSSERELITARREFEKAEGEVNRLKEVFKIYTIGKRSDYVLKAPIAGFVVEKNVNHDMQIRSDKADKLFTIAQLNEVWVVANVYETDIARVREGFEARVVMLSYPDQVLTGKVDKVYNVLDPLTRTMKVRIRLPNPDYRLKPDMFANVTIRYAENRELPTIPGQAVIFDKSRSFVMLYRDRCQVETREVEVDRTLDGQAFVRRGLSPGEQVISRYQLMIYDALND